MKPVRTPRMKPLDSNWYERFLSWLEDALKAAADWVGRREVESWQRRYDRKYGAPDRCQCEGKEGDQPCNQAVSRGAYCADCAPAGCGWLAERETVIAGEKR